MAYNLQQVVFTKMPIVNQTTALEVFDQMDEILEFCVRRIVGLRSTVFCLVDISAEIGSSLTHGRLIFNRLAVPQDDKVAKPDADSTADAPVKTPKNYGGPARLEDLLTYNNESDMESIVFLEKIFKIYNCWTVAGVVAVEDIFALNLCRATYEAVLQDFLSHTKDYQDLCMQSSRTRDMFFEKIVDDDNALTQQLTNIEERMSQIELTVGCERSKLFAVRHQIETEMKKYKKLKEHVYHAYLRIVYKVAREKAKNEQQVLDNFQNGAIGLLRAISTYNPTRGVFSSYAQTWTKQHILLKIKEESNAIRLPISIWQTNNDLNEIQARLATDANHHIVDNDTLAEESGLGLDRVAQISEYFQTTRVVSMENQSSLDSSEFESRKEEGYDPYEPLPFIDAHLDLLTPRQSFILFLVYGMYERLPGDLPTSLVDITREQLRQKIAEKIYSTNVDTKPQDLS